MSQPLPLQDQCHLEAAKGWLKLGSYFKASQELEKIDTTYRTHPDVLDARWQVYWQGRQWHACEDIARVIIKLDPSKPNPWIKLARSIHVRGGTEEAFRILLEVVYLFPKCSDIYYELAVFACQLGRVEQARANLATATDIADDPDKVRLLALKDPELSSLRA